MIRKYSFKSDSIVLPEPSAMVSSASSGRKICPAKNFVETHKFQGVGENETGNIPLTFIINAGVEFVLFKDFTENHNKTYFQIGSPTLGPEFLDNNLLVRVTTDSSDAPLEYNIPLSQTRAFQVENFSFLAIRFNDEVGLRQAAVEVFIQKTFCVMGPVE
ncbi:hypothetical protein [Sutcliffiella horikoshii]|uniref:hypothetical protein n=1 Tax=Sutcliffiella horikoshii TaxID=79883 RepID=UPI001CFCB198|nr:hypothetical protein [Sutcliffiella horikoshii]